MTKEKTKQKTLEVSEIMVGKRPVWLSPKITIEDFKSALKLAPSAKNLLGDDLLICLLQLIVRGVDGRLVTFFELQTDMDDMFKMSELETLIGFLALQISPSEEDAELSQTSYKETDDGISFEVLEGGEKVLVEMQELRYKQVRACTVKAQRESAKVREFVNSLLCLQESLVSFGDKKLDFSKDWPLSVKSTLQLIEAYKRLHSGEESASPLEVRTKIVSV